MLGWLLLHDVKRGADGVGSGDADGVVNLKGGVNNDRLASVHDPGMRHGHKCESQRLDGDQAATAVDTDSHLTTAMDVLPGNDPDYPGA